MVEVEPHVKKHIKHEYLIFNQLTQNSPSYVPHVINDTPV